MIKQFIVLLIFFVLLRLHFRSLSSLLKQKSETRMRLHQITSDEQIFLSLAKRAYFTALPSLFSSSFFPVPCEGSLVFYTTGCDAYSCTTDGYGIFNGAPMSVHYTGTRTLSRTSAKLAGCCSCWIHVDVKVEGTR